MFRFKCLNKILFYYTWYILMNSFSVSVHLEIIVVCLLTKLLQLKLDK